ncbi:hypothetical protein DFJ73DRAFT_323813 [Zopfochytrium polystomum]|nr:hypothetical protein DFJ73DRAFT_323813 [Zopfochytrium polystomum]
MRRLALQTPPPTLNCFRHRARRQRQTWRCTWDKQKVGFSQSQNQPALRRRRRRRRRILPASASPLRLAKTNPHAPMARISRRIVLALIFAFVLFACFAVGEAAAKKDKKAADGKDKKADDKDPKAAAAAGDDKGAGGAALKALMKKAKSKKGRSALVVAGLFSHATLACSKIKSKKACPADDEKKAKSIMCIMCVARRAMVKKLKAKVQAAKDKSAKKDDKKDDKKKDDKKKDAKKDAKKDDKKAVKLRAAHVEAEDSFGADDSFLDDEDAFDMAELSDESLFEEDDFEDDDLLEDDEFAEAEGLY